MNRNTLTRTQTAAALIFGFIAGAVAVNVIF